MLPLKPNPKTQHRQTNTNPSKTPDYFVGLGATVQGIRPRRPEPPNRTPDNIAGLGGQKRINQATVRSCKSLRQFYERI
jgi:hypothetical protein